MFCYGGIWEMTKRRLALLISLADIFDNLFLTLIKTYNRVIYVQVTKPPGSARFTKPPSGHSSAGYNYGYEL